MGLRIPTKTTITPQATPTPTAIQVQPKETSVEVQAKAVEQIILRNGDISSLSPVQRVEYYKNLCESLGLNPLTIPIMYIGFKDRNGNYKIIPYLVKDGSAQLSAKHKVSVNIKEKIWCKETNTYQVWVEATTPDGRKTEDAGIVTLGEQAKGDIVANAILKAITKAKRRVILSHCGLGFLDESEIETIQGQKQVMKIEELPTEKPVQIESQETEESEEEEEKILWEKTELMVAKLLEMIPLECEKAKKIKIIDSIVGKTMTESEVQDEIQKVMAT